MSNAPAHASNRPPRNSPRHVIYPTYIQEANYAIDGKYIPEAPVVFSEMDESGLKLYWYADESGCANTLGYDVYFRREGSGLSAPRVWRKLRYTPRQETIQGVTVLNLEANNSYSFIVRPIDEYNRRGPFSVPITFTIELLNSVANPIRST